MRPFGYYLQKLVVLFKVPVMYDNVPVSSKVPHIATNFLMNPDASEMIDFKGRAPTITHLLNKYGCSSGSY